MTVDLQSIFFFAAISVVAIAERDVDSRQMGRSRHDMLEGRGQENDGNSSSHTSLHKTGFEFATSMLEQLSHRVKGFAENEHYLRTRFGKADVQNAVSHRTDGTNNANKSNQHVQLSASARAHGFDSVAEELTRLSNHMKNFAASERNLSSRLNSTHKNGTVANVTAADQIPIIIALERSINTSSSDSGEPVDNILGTEEPVDDFMGKLDCTVKWVRQFSATNEGVKALDLRMKQIKAAELLILQVSRLERNSSNIDGNQLDQYFSVLVDETQRMLERLIAAKVAYELTLQDLLHRAQREWLNECGEVDARIPASLYALLNGIQSQVDLPAIAPSNSGKSAVSSVHISVPSKSTNTSAPPRGLLQRVRQKGKSGVNSIRISIPNKSAPPRTKAVSSGGLGLQDSRARNASAPDHKLDVDHKRGVAGSIVLHITAGSSQGSGSGAGSKPQPSGSGAAVHVVSGASKASTGSDDRVSVIYTGASFNRSSSLRRGNGWKSQSVGNGTAVLGSSLKVKNAPSKPAESKLDILLYTGEHGTTHQQHNSSSSPSPAGSQQEIGITSSGRSDSKIALLKQEAVPKAKSNAVPAVDGLKWSKDAGHVGDANQRINTASLTAVHSTERSQHSGPSGEILGNALQQKNNRSKGVGLPGNASEADS